MTAGASSVILSQKQFFFNLNSNESYKMHCINKIKTEMCEKKK